MSSPRRIAVVILFAILGWLLDHFDVVPQALLPAILLGMLVANFVPARRACGTTRDET